MAFNLLGKLLYLKIFPFYLWRDIFYKSQDGELFPEMYSFLFLFLVFLLKQVVDKFLKILYLALQLLYFIVFHF